MPFLIDMDMQGWVLLMLMLGRREGVERGLKGGRSFSLRQSCNTHVSQREMG